MGSPLDEDIGTTEAGDVSFLSGGGQVGALMRAFPWRLTTLGEPHFWPQALKTTVGILLNSGYPMYLAWGPEFLQIYNDAYLPILASHGSEVRLAAINE